MSMQSSAGRGGIFGHIDEVNRPLFICVTLLGMIGVLVLYSVAGGDFSPWAWRHGLRVVAVKSNSRHRCQSGVAQMAPTREDDKHAAYNEQGGIECRSDHQRRCVTKNVY